MKRIIVVILFFSLVLCSCVRGYTEETSISSFDSSNGNCADINIAAMDIDLSFDDVVSICSDCLHVDILAYGESEWDNLRIDILYIMGITHHTWIVLMVCLSQRERYMD